MARMTAGRKSASMPLSSGRGNTCTSIELSGHSFHDLPYLLQGQHRVHRELDERRELHGAPEGIGFSPLTDAVSGITPGKEPPIGYQAFIQGFLGHLHHLTE